MMSFVEDRELIRVANMLLDQAIGLDEKRAYLMGELIQSGMSGDTSEAELKAVLRDLIYCVGRRERVGLVHVLNAIFNAPLFDVQ
jgi:hypothetical protein